MRRGHINFLVTLILLSNTVSIAEATIGISEIEINKNVENSEVDLEVENKNGEIENGEIENGEIENGEIENENSSDRNDVNQNIMEENGGGEELDNKLKEQGEVKSKGVISRPLNESKVTDKIYLRSTINNIKNGTIIKVLVNDKLYSEEQYKNTDIEKYSYNKEIQGLKNGLNKITLNTYFNNNLESTNSVDLQVVNSGYVKITGRANVDKYKMYEFLRIHNKEKSYAEVKYFVDTVINEANIENIRYDIAFAQMMLETNFLKFGGDVTENQNNFGGLGATGNGVPGESFPSVQIGIRAVIQHLKAYANYDKLVNELVDTRFNYVKRGTAQIVQYLGINENPYGGGWAADTGYGYKIINMMDRINNTKPQFLLSMKFSSERKVGQAIRLEANSNQKNVEYKFEVKDNATNKYSTIKDFSSSNVAQWNLTKEGNYMVAVTARNKSTGEIKTVYQNGFNIVKGDPMQLNFKFSSERKVGQAIRLEANSNQKNVEYKFEVKDNATNKYSTIKDFSSSNVAQWNLIKEGNYMVAVTARNKSTGEIKTVYQNGFNIVKGDPMQLNFKFSSERKVGQAIRLEANSNQKNVEYKFEVKDNATNKYSTIKDFSSSNVAQWNLTKEGNYMVAVTARNKSTGEIKTVYQNGFNIVKGDSMQLNFKFSSERKVGQTIRLEANSNQKNVEYKFEVKDNATNKYSTIKDFSSSNVAQWNLTKEGNYMVAVTARNKLTGETKTIYQNGFNIAQEEPISLILKYGSQRKIGETLKIEAMSNREGLQYKFEIRNNTTGQDKILKNYSTSNIAMWHLDAVGSYMIVVTARDIQTKEEKTVSKNGFIIDYNKPNIVDLNFDFDFGIEGPQTNNPNKIILHHAAGNSTAASVHNYHKLTNGWAGIGYHFYIHKDGTIYKGREENWRGAHAADIPSTPGYNDGNPLNDTNATSIGIAVQGNYHPETHISVDKTMPKAQEDAVVKVGQYLVEKYGVMEVLKHGAPTIGHTSCPGNYYPFDRIRARILSKYVYGVYNTEL